MGVGMLAGSHGLWCRVTRCSVFPLRVLLWFMVSPETLEGLLRADQQREPGNCVCVCERERRRDREKGSEQTECSAASCLAFSCSQGGYFGIHSRPSSGL